MFEHRVLAGPRCSRTSCPAANAVLRVIATLYSEQPRSESPLKRALIDGTARTRYDAYKAVRGLVDELRNVKLFDAEADSILWAAEGLLLATRPTDPEAVEARTTFDTLMGVLPPTAGRTPVRPPPGFSGNG